ncbi:hypothetical protein CFP56_015982 [Quercus suber]|uniref:Uncharacterized protein n=1 Tax=Quercus suber TaxID=58331 RepID=A0AAW0KNC8_QUESU
MYTHSSAMMSITTCDRRRQLALVVKEISAVSKLSEQRSWSHPLHHCSGPDLKNKEPIWLLINTIDKLISIKNFSSLFYRGKNN